MLVVSSCGDDSGSDDGASRRVAVLSAFPAELAPLAEQISVDETMEVNGHLFRVGTLGGVPVVLGLTGIGLINAAATTHALLEQFDVRGVVVSAVAGSTLLIGDVTVPAIWGLPDGTSYSADRKWLRLADKIAVPGAVALQRCTVPVSMPAAGEQCVLGEPAIVVGGTGQSSDPYNGRPFACQPGAGDVFGCDVSPTPTPTASTSAGARSAAEEIAAVAAETPVAVDMETAAIAREAAARGVPFIAFRAVSDGAGDPLGLPGFPSQFFAYYRLAAHNAAAAAVAFLHRL